MEQFHALKEELKACGCTWKEEVSLKPYTTLHIGGNARLLVEPSTIQEIQHILRAAHKTQVPYVILGNGSNILITDHGFSGLVIVLSKNYCNMTLENDTRIRSEAGANIMDVCMFAWQHSLTNLEFAYGIPGTCGGTCFMNAGAYGGEVGDVIVECTVLNEYGNIEIIRKDDLKFSYRHSAFIQRNVCILEVVYQLEKGDAKQIKQRMDDLFKRRQEKQPLQHYSAGSTFKRPMGNYASALINECGLKGYTYGDAMVSTKHTGFLINKGNATAKEFLTLIEHVQKIVYEKTGYELECEIKII